MTLLTQLLRPAANKAIQLTSVGSPQLYSLEAIFILIRRWAWTFSMAQWCALLLMPSNQCTRSTLGCRWGFTFHLEASELVKNIWQSPFLKENWLKFQSLTFRFIHFVSFFSRPFVLRTCSTSSSRWCFLRPSTISYPKRRAQWKCWRLSPTSPSPYTPTSPFRRH